MNKILIGLPDWLEEVFSVCNKREFYPSTEERMSLAIELSAQNIKNGGGPFGAAVFEEKTGKLISVGVNLVLPLNLSIAHAEIVAMMFAQKRENSFNLNRSSGKTYQLATSANPCAQCFGALAWSGISSVISAANKDDVEKIGFDEGPVPKNWKEEMKLRGILVRDNFMREQAAKVLQDYQAQSGIIYNG